MKQRFFCSALAIAGVVSAVSCSHDSSGARSSLTAPTPGAAAARGNGAPDGKLVFSWNLIGTPGDNEGGCGNGRRVFVDRGASKAQILFENDTDWSIAQCDATGGDRAVIHSADLAKLDVYARILGKPGGSLHVCAMTLEDFTNGETLCLLGTIDMTRGQKEKFEFKNDMLFDASVEDVLWQVDTNPDFRIVQFRVYATGS